MTLHRWSVYTVGHSIHPAPHFVELLATHGIEIVLDVRSSPFSSRAPQYNRVAMKEWLAGAGIRYSFGGSALGGRPNSPLLYHAGQADYRRMAETEEFRLGLRRVASAARKHRVALVCAEADPIECHRFLLVGRALSAGGVNVQHILANGTLETHRNAERRMFTAVGLLQAGFFDDDSDATERAYAIQSRRFAYTVGTGFPRPDIGLTNE